MKILEYLREGQGLQEDIKMDIEKEIKWINFFIGFLEVAAIIEGIAIIILLNRI